MFNPLQFYREIQLRLKKGQLILELHEYLRQENGTVMRLIWFPTGQIGPDEIQAEASIRIKDICKCNYGTLASTANYVAGELQKDVENKAQATTTKGLEKALKKSQDL